MASDPICQIGVELDNIQTLASECHARMCRDEIEVPQTREDLAQLRQRYGMGQFKPQNHSGIKRGRELHQRLRALGAQQLIDEAMVGSVPKLIEFFDLISMVAQVTPEGAVFNSSVNIGPEARTALGPLIKRLGSDTNTGSLLLSFLQYESFDGGDQIFFPQVSGEVEKFFTVELPSNATNPSPQELAMVRSAYKIGWSSMTNSRRREIQRIVRDVIVLPLRRERLNLTALMQEWLRIGRESLESDLREAELTCNLSDFYRRRAEKMQSSGGVSEWEMQARKGLRSQVINIFSGSERTAVESVLDQCKVKVYYPEAMQRVDRTGLIKELDEVRAALGSCGLQGQLYDHVALAYGGELRLNLSASTLAYGGDNVFFHEMGHCFSQALTRAGLSESSTRLKGLFSCLRSMHGGTDRYLEEDFADWISARIAPDSMNVGCYLSDVIQLSTVNYEPHPQDNHSSPLFRALHGSVLRGEALPPSCSSLISQSERRPIACGL